MLCVICVSLNVKSRCSVETPSRFRWCIFSERKNVLFVANSQKIWKLLKLVILIQIFLCWINICYPTSAIILKFQSICPNIATQTQTQWNWTPLWLLFMNIFSFGLKHTQSTKDNTTWERWIDRSYFIHINSFKWITLTHNTFLKAFPKCIAQQNQANVQNAI